MSIKAIVMGAGAYSAGKPLTVSYVTTTGQNPGFSTTVTFSGVSLGTPQAGRRIYVVVLARRNGSVNISGVTVAGASATLFSQTDRSGYGDTPTYRACAVADATNSTGTIVVTTDVIVPWCQIFVYAVYGQTTTLASCQTGISTTFRAVDSPPQSVTSIQATAQQVASGGFTLCTLYSSWTYDIAPVTFNGAAADTSIVNSLVAATYADNPMTAYAKSYTATLTGFSSINTLAFTVNSFKV